MNTKYASSKMGRHGGKLHLAIDDRTVLCTPNKAYSARRTSLPVGQVNCKDCRETVGRILISGLLAAVGQGK